MTQPDGIIYIIIYINHITHTAVQSITRSLQDYITTALHLSHYIITDSDGLDQLSPLYIAVLGADVHQ